VGFGRFAALAELDTTMAVFWGGVDVLNASVRGVALSLVPSGALAITF
jgi:hypothetical protein